MVITAAAFAVIAPQAVSGEQTTFEQRGGASTRSPDGKWQIFSRPGDSSRAWEDPRSDASLWLHTRKGDRFLTRYRRDGSLYWLGDGRRALFVHRDTHFHDARLFTLSGTAVAERRVQSVVIKGMAAISPRLGSIENRSIDVRLRKDGGLCLSVEESGLPPGRSVGSFVAKTGIFRVDSDGQISSVRSCGDAAEKS